LRSPLLKRRTRQHVVADLAINHVERVFLECGHTADRTQHDYGIDIFVSSYDNRGFVESGYLLVQVKATDRLRQVAHGQRIAVRVETAHIAAWTADPMPLGLVVYDASAGRAFWVNVKDEVKRGGLGTGWRRAKSATLHVPIRQEFDQLAVAQLVAAKAAAVRRSRAKE
jgi:hypothetical protein